jgi:hemolysin activation/secretion protein
MKLPLLLCAAGLGLSAHVGAQTPAAPLSPAPDYAAPYPTVQWDNNPAPEAAKPTRVLDVKTHELRAIEGVHTQAENQTQTEAMNVRLQTLVADPANDLGRIAQELTVLYRSFGYPVAQVVVDDADIEAAFSTGILRWRVLEGLYGHIGVIAAAPDTATSGTATQPSPIAEATLHRLKMTLSLAICGKASELANVCIDVPVQTQGGPNGAAGLERALLLANELPDTRVALPQFTAGQGVGQTDATFKVQARGVRHGLTLESDNYGGKATGVVRTGLTYSASNVLGWGESASYNRVQTNSNQHNDSYLISLPVGYDGWRVAFAQAQMQYQLGGGFAGVAKGQSETQTLSAAYPLIRRFDRTLRLNTSYSKSQSNTSYYEGLVKTHSNTERYSLSVQEELDDVRQSSMPFIPSHTLWSAALTQGFVRLDADSLASDQSGPKAAGGYSKLAYSLMRKQSLNAAKQWSATTLLRGQLASKNLDGSEKMSLGGVSGVRAYPGGEVSSDVAHIVSVDVKRQFANKTRDGFWALGAFADYGIGQLGKFEWTQGATHQYTVSGYGVSLDGSTKWGALWGNTYAQFGLVWAHRGMPKNSGIEPETKARSWAYLRLAV